MTNPAHLLMVSFDAVADQDIDLLLTLPNFSALCRRGTLVRKVSSVVVSNTYPTHTTIQTGVLPRTHGVFDNEVKSPSFRTERWRFQADNILVPTLSGEAARAGKTVCTILYPVTGGARTRYNFPEIAGHVPPVKRAWRTLRYGSAGFVVSSILRHWKLLDALKTVNLDTFTATVACRMIEKKKPDLTMIHLLDVDTEKHNFGPESPKAKAALHRLDAHLGELMDSITRSGMADDFSIIVFSDHACCPVHTCIEANELLKTAGIPYTDAYFHEAGGTCFLQLFDSCDKDRISAFVDRFLQAPYVDRLLTGKEMFDSGADLTFAYGFSASPGYCFGEHMKGQHGYTLDRDKYNTFYLAAGGKVPQGEVASGGSLLNICPLAVDLLGLEPWPMEGKNLLFERG